MTKRQKDLHAAIKRAEKAGITVEIPSSTFNNIGAFIDAQVEEQLERRKNSADVSDEESLEKAVGDKTTVSIDKIIEEKEGNDD